MYWQYTTALAGSLLAATNPVISSVDNAIESFILVSSLVLHSRLGVREKNCTGTRHFASRACIRIPFRRGFRLPFDNGIAEFAELRPVQQSKSGPTYRSNE
jgi:hypothetical protein